MIRFPCRCGRMIEVADDLAGGDAQCPACGLLNAIPTLGDAAVGLHDDGTYTFDDEQPEVAALKNEERLRALHRAYTRNTTAPDGSQIDNRITLEELVVAGEIPVADETALHERPKYDPVTGELVRPIEIKRDEGPAEDDIPLAKAAITYAAGAPRPTNLAGAVHLLTSPGNLAVLGVVFLLHLFVLGIFRVAAVFVFMLLFAFAILLGVIAHFGNTVDEVGPKDMDELPRPFRDLEPAEDIFWPFIQCVVATTLAFGPTMYVQSNLHLPPAAQMALLSVTLLWGVVAFPALLLTTTTSGTFLNLRPDRLFGVIKAGAGSYVGLCLVGVVALASYLVGFAGALAYASPRAIGGIWSRPIVAFPLWFVGIFMMHLFCYQLGLYYRQHNHAFDWVYQRHMKRNLAEEEALRAARRAVRKHEQAERAAYRSTSRNMGPRW
jgi:hypothetical protein